MNYFTPATDPLLFTCPCGKCSLDPLPELIDRLNVLRHLYGKPIVVNSGVRCKEYERSQGRDGTSAHTLGAAADLQCTNSRDRDSLLNIIYTHQLFRRKGVGANFLHVDVSTAPHHAQDVCWTYYT